MFVEYTQRYGTEVVRRGLNPELITHWETKPQGGITLHAIGGAVIELDKAQWDEVGQQFDHRRQEPPAGQKPATEPNA